MIKKIWSLLISKKGVFIINICLTSLGLFNNYISQAYCNPSLWASITIGLSLLFVILSPFDFLKNSNSPIVGLVAGISFFSFIYCIMFLGEINVIAIPLILLGIGIILLTPHLFAFQLIRSFFFKTPFNRVRYSFIIGVVSCFCISIYSGMSYKHAMNKISQLEKSYFTELEPNFMTEKVLGMHFIYHTKICIYDGWRPPIHEPLLVMGMWWNGMKDPLGVSLEERLRLYRKFFPDNEVKFNCSCAINESTTYHNDELWN